MPIDLKSESNFRLGELQIRPAACEVLGDRGRRSLQPKVMQVLVALARARKAVVSRDQLTDEVWNGVVVGEDSVTRVIGRLRRIAEWAGPDSFTIRTVPKIGFILSGADANSMSESADLLLAVLPFDNLSDDPTLQFVSDGVSEEILQTIARGASIAVIGRSSTFQFRGQDKSIERIAQGLRATHILDGAVRANGPDLRVSAHLTDVASQTVIWSDRFECPRADMFEVQDRIAESVAAALDRTFARSRRPAAIDPVGYDLYLRGAEFARHIDPSSQAQAVALLEQAAARLPDFADVWGELALARAQAHFLRFEPRSPETDKARAAAVADAERARAIDPRCRSAELLPYVGGALFDFAEHRRRFEQPRPSALATTASPDVSLGVQLLEIGRAAEALEFFRQAERFDPLFQIQTFYHAHALAAVDDLGGAIARLDASIARWPGIPFFAATRITWAACMEDWPTVERLMSGERGSLLRDRQDEIAGLVGVCRQPAASASDLRRLRDQAFAIGKCGLEAVLVHARRAGLAETLRLVDDDARPIVDFDAPRRPDDIGAIALALPFFAQVRRDPLFPALWQRLRLPTSAPQT